MKYKDKYKWIDFIRPSGYWCYSVEQFFGVYQWLVKTAIERKQHYQPGAVELLSMKPTCLNMDVPECIYSLENLQRRFHYVLLDDCNTPIVRQWKEDLKIDVNESVEIPFRHYVPFKGGILCGKKVCEADIKKAFESFFSMAGTLKEAPNKYHKNMTEIRGGEISVYKDRFFFNLKYAAPDDSEFCSRTFTLAQSDAEKEPFLDGFSRALARSQELKVEVLAL